MRTRRVCFVALLVAACATTVPAQVWTPGKPGPTRELAATRDLSTLRLEARVDYQGGDSNAWFAGGGLSARAGNYVRIGANAGVGPMGVGGNSSRLMGDIVARFMLDPLRQSPLGVSLGGGIGARYQRERARVFALLFVDVEGGRDTGWTPFIRAGVGGGVRLAVGLRQAASAGR